MSIRLNQGDITGHFLAMEIWSDVNEAAIERTYSCDPVGHFLRLLSYDEIKSSC